jgi:hypothetical protein
MDLRYDERVADAMNRVLEAERTARSAVADCERQMQLSLEQARQQRRTILERAHDRIMALHQRAVQALERRTADILARHKDAEGPVTAPKTDGANLKTAIEKFAERLTCRAEEEL